jgi:hypothetical protein
MARLFVGGSLLVPSIASLFFITAVHEADSAAPAGSAVTVKSIRGKCGMCHREIAQEWLTSLHSQAFQDTHFTTELAKVPEAERESKCFTCHAPEVVRAKGLGQTPGFRTDLREVGVDCVVCHTNPKGKVHAPFRTGASPHDVEEDPQHKTEALCASCHDAFGTATEFKQTSFAKQGQTCATCHMPKVQRPAATGGKPRLVSSHVWKGGDDPATLKKAVKMEASVKPDGTVTAKIANFGAGHKFPTGNEHHQALLLVTVTDGGGKEVFTNKVLFANETKSGGADTRINPGETRTVTVPTNVTAGSFTARLLYKKVSTLTDAEAKEAASATMKL